jgi:Ni/Co efflux regulator RcnB
MKRLLTAVAALSLAGTFALGTAASAQTYEFHHHHDDNYYHRTGYHDERPDPAWHGGAYPGFSAWDRAHRVDPYRYNLYPAAPGYEWRWVDGDFVLGAVATGLIVDVIPGDEG